MAATFSLGGSAYSRCYSGIAHISCPVLRANIAFTAKSTRVGPLLEDDTIRSHVLRESELVLRELLRTHDSLVNGLDGTLTLRGTKLAD